MAYVSDKLNARTAQEKWLNTALPVLRTSCLLGRGRRGSSISPLNALAGAKQGVEFLRMRGSAMLGNFQWHQGHFTGSNPSATYRIELLN